MIKKILLIFLIFIQILSFFLASSDVFAKSDFDINNELEIKYDFPNDFVTVTEEVTLKVNNDKYYLRRGAIQTFFLPDTTIISSKKERDFKLNSLKVTNYDKDEMKYTKSTEDNGILIEVPIPQQVSSYEEYTIKIQYKARDLVNVSGNISNLYVPGLPIDTKFTSTSVNGLVTTKNYKTSIVTSRNTPSPSYTQPKNIEVKSTEKSYIYEIDQADRIGKTSWLQFGNTQYYKFKLLQQALKTDSLTPTQVSDVLPLVSTNIYKIALPRETEETNQQVKIININPKPKNITRDNEGNLLATFDTPANKESQIIVEGLIKVSIPIEKEVQDIELGDYFEKIKSKTELQQYLNKDKYWESDDPVVKKIANEIHLRSNTILDLVRNDYNYIVNKFNYSFTKLEGDNPRLGAKAALTGAPTICMEYADSLIALLRSQGIPARAAIGYGNDPHNSENKIGSDKLEEQTIGHQWVEVWIPDYGWLSLDPTWGESNRTYIGGDLDHILWYSQASSNQDISDVVFFSAERGSIGKYQVFLQALNEIEYLNLAKEAKSINEIKTEQNIIPEDIDMYIKTSLAGRIMVYLLPIVVAISLSTIITWLIYFLKRRSFRKETS